MKKKQLLLPTALLAMLASQGMAQTVASWPAVASGTDAAMAAQKMVANQQTFKPLEVGFGSAADAWERQQWVEAHGELPKQEFHAPMRAEEGVTYTYSGFNLEAGGAGDNGMARAGMVNFNLNPFAGDSVCSDGGLSPYAFVKDGKLYAIQAIQNRSDGTCPKQQRTIYDANTFELLEQETFDTAHGGKTSYCGMYFAYDELSDVIWALSTETVTVYTPLFDNIETTYLNIYDPATGRLKRVGALGQWKYTNEGKDNYTLKSLCCIEGNLYSQLKRGDKMVLVRIDPYTLENKQVGKTDITTNGCVDLNPMIMKNETTLLVNHYDLYTGTTYYEVSTLSRDQGATVKTTEVEKLPTGYSMFYQRPETLTQTPSNMEPVEDLAVSVDDAFTEISVTFTVPSRMADGSELEYPFWVTDMQKSVRPTIFIDGNATTAVVDCGSSVAYGKTATAKVVLADNSWLDIKPGLHTVALKLFSNYSEAKFHNCSVTSVFGSDAPSAVSSPKLSIADGVATISWSAPTEAQHEDFGGVFDSSALTYTVVRDDDQKVVAQDITGLSCTDPIDRDEYIQYSYTVYASANGAKSPGATTDKVLAGSYAALPYQNGFPNQKSLDTWSWSDEMPKAWRYHGANTCLGTVLGAADGSIYTPPFRLEAGKVYEVSLQVRGNGVLNVSYGKQMDDQTQIALATLNRAGGKVGGKGCDEYKHFYMQPAEDGEYRIRLHDYNGAGEDNWWIIDSFGISEVSQSGAPAACQATFTPDEGGIYSGVVTATLPAVTNDGKDVGAITSLVVVDGNGNEVGRSTNPAATVKIPVEAEHGWNSYRVIASNEAGAGCPASLSGFVGLDTPRAPQNLRISWTDKTNAMLLQWDNSPVGVNGGYVDVDNLVYNVYRNSELKPVASTEDKDVTIEILDNQEQDVYTLGLTAVNDEGESGRSLRSIVLGKPYDLPVEEKLDDSGMTMKPYTQVSGENGQNWALDGGFHDANVQPKNSTVALVMVNHGQADGGGTFATPILDFTKAQNPVMTVWLHHTPGMNDGSYVDIKGNTEGSNYQSITDKASLAGGNGWQLHTFDLSAMKGKLGQVGIHAYVPVPRDRVFADWFTIGEAKGSDLALSGISQTRYEKVGDQIDVRVTVANMGKETISDYSVMFSVNGEVVAETEGDAPLAMGQEKVFTFPVKATAAANGQTTYQAEVVCDADENEANNVSPEMTVNVLQPELPAPANLVAESDQLSWEAPVVAEGTQTVLGFEDTPSFITGEIEGWKVVDGDHHANTYFQQYYGNYWPLCGNRVGWYTWNVAEAGNAETPIWKAYNSTRCIVTWGNYGGDEAGHDNSNEPQDDWFISPEIVGGTDFSFMTRCINPKEGHIAVMVSTTGRDPEDFTEMVTDYDMADGNTWHKVSAQLPGNAKYVALHVDVNYFGVMVDDISYTAALTPVLQGYNAYCGTELKGTPTQTTFATNAGGVWAVSAQYDLGESALSNKTQISGIEDIVEAAKGQTVYYDLQGRRVADPTNGVFIKVRGSKATKVRL